MLEPYKLGECPNCTGKSKLKTTYNFATHFFSHIDCWVTCDCGSVRIHYTIYLTKENHRRIASGEITVEKYMKERKNGAV